MVVTDTMEGNLKLASEIAAGNLLIAQQELARRILDPTITTKGLLDIAEHEYKVSGMAKKQEAKDEGGKFILNINLSGGKSVKLEKTINGETVDDASPEALLSAANLLVGEIDFASAPEFC